MKEQEFDFDKVYGGAPQAAVSEFPRPKAEGELSFEELTEIYGTGITAHDIPRNLENQVLFRPEAIKLQKEIDAMFAEQAAPTDENSNQRTI